jgi:hypothetical protein
MSEHLSREVLMAAMNELRDNYRCEGPTWVLPPDVYDAAKKQVEDGTASWRVRAIFADSIRDEAALEGEQDHA